MKPKTPIQSLFANSLAMVGLASALLITAGSSQSAGATSAAIFGGGPVYSGGLPVMNTLRSSGFSTVVLWTIHVYGNGDLVLNDQLIVSVGAYVGASTWPAQLATLKQSPTSVNRIKVSVGSWGVNDFLAVKNLIASQGTNSSGVLYRNFQALRSSTGADAIDFDDETLYDVATMVTFGQMLASLGYKVSLCPYNNSAVWQSVKSQLGNVVDAVYLQCYAGGAGNNPATWNGYFGGLKVHPGLWCLHGGGCSSGDSAASVEAKMTNWKSSAGITGGFMWLFDDMLSCTANTPAQYATAITGSEVLPTLTITANPQSKTYGTVLNLGSKVFTASGLVGTDLVTDVALTASGGTNAADAVGEYTITPSAAVGTNGFLASNYNITYVPGMLTVNPAVSVWTGACTNNNWSADANWDVPPVNSATLFFDGTTRLTPNQDSATVTNFASLRFKSTAGCFVLGGNAIGLTTAIENDSTSPQNVNLPIYLGGGTSLQLLTKLNSGDLTISGVISGAVNLGKYQQAASTVLVLLGANGYSGTTTISAGNVSISSIKNVGGVPNSLGQPNQVSSVIQFGGGAANPCTLIYTGTGDTTDRGLWLYATGLGSCLTIRQSGSGLLKFTGHFWATSADATQRRLILDGSTAGAGELAAAITNTTYGSTGIQIAKNGTGTWALSGTNTTASATSINAGKLVGVTGGSSGNSACTVSSNATSGVRIHSAGGRWTYKTLTLNDGSFAEFDFGSSVVPSATVAPLQVSNLTFVGTVGVGVIAGALTAPGTYPLIKYTGTLLGTPPTTAKLPLHVAGTLVNNTGAKSIDLNVTAVTNAPPIHYVIHISCDGMHADAPRRS